MGHTLLCGLGLFSLSLLLYCGYAQDAVLTIELNWSTLFTGENVTFICDMREGEDTDWYYAIHRDGQEFLPFSSDKTYTSQSLSKGHSGEYQCIGAPKRSPYSRKQSNKVSLTVLDKDVILQSPASTVFKGESVTLRCRHRNQTKEKNAVFYKDGSPIKTDTNHQSAMSSENTVQVISDGSSYMCKFEDEESEPVELKMEPQPKARLRKYIPSGGNVTLTCSVSSSSSSSSGWKYFWYRGEKTSEPLTTQDVVFLSNDTIRVSQGGLYWCRGGRGGPLYFTEYSDLVVTNRAVVTLRPNWPEIYYQETITLTCEIEDGGDAEWEYEWTTSSSYRLEKQKENMIRKALLSYKGEYRCMGTLKHEKSSTEWSDAFTLRVSDHKPRPVLTVSPLWLSPGASVTLSCSVEHASAGWRFFWYKAVPKLSDTSYSYELIPGSINGTEQDSYIVDGETHTAGFVCIAGRGDPVYYTHYSGPKFVWSGDSHSAASLTVSPDRMQHFNREPVSLSCEGNSEWRVSRFSGDGYQTHCSSSSSSSSWGTMTGSRCNMSRYWQSGVYWCESDTGQFSNAVNITNHYGDIILVSPVHPVTEGDSVTLGCKLRAEKVPYNVDFYKNNKLIPNVTGGELTISAVSKSDEGFYKCTGKKSQGWQSLTSPESWMSVKSASRPEQSPAFPVLLIVGPVCGVLLILLLLLFVCCYRKSKDSCFMRSQSSSWSPAPDHMINQDETQLKEYAPPLHGDAVLYESIKDFEEPEHGESNDVTYSVVELKNVTKKGKKKAEPEERAVYSDVKIRSATGKSRPVAADETVYSEVKPAKALDQ